MTYRSGPRTIKEERQLFEEMVDELLSTGKEGQYVLFKDGKIEGFFSSEQAAYEAGLDRYGLAPFLVDLVTRPAPCALEPWLQAKSG